MDVVVALIIAVVHSYVSIYFIENYFPSSNKKKKKMTKEEEAKSLFSGIAFCFDKEFLPKKEREKKRK